MIERCGIFIDGGYLLSALRGEFKVQGDFPINPLKMTNDLIQTLHAGRLQRAYYYDCLPFVHDPPRKEDEDRHAMKEKLFDFINSLPGFEVRLGELKMIVGPGGRENYTQKGVDLLMGIDLVRLSSKGAISDAILISGDADFVPAAETAKDEGVHVSCVTGKNAAKSLIQVCDNHIMLTQPMLKKWLAE